MTAMVLAILVASLVGSMHCAGMCGAFVGLVTHGASGTRHAFVAQGAYHVGRLVSYVGLGMAAGAAGQLVDVAGALAGWRPLAAGLAGATMVAFGAGALLRSLGVNIAVLRLPGGWSRFIARMSSAAMSRPPVVRAATIGLFTTLLPCGWLYAFAVTAAGTAKPAAGALVMAVFWVGTLPALIVVGVGVRGVLGRIGARAPVVTALLLIVVGLFTVVGRARLDPVALAQRSSHAGTNATPACCEPTK